MRRSSERMHLNVRENRELGNSDPAVGAQTRSRPYIRMNGPSPPRAVQASCRLASASRPPAALSLGRLTTVPIVTRQVVSRPFKTHDHGFPGSVRRCGHAREQGELQASDSISSPRIPFQRRCRESGAGRRLVAIHQACFWFCMHQAFFISFFLDWQTHKLNTGLSRWCAPN